MGRLHPPPGQHAQADRLAHDGHVWDGGAYTCPMPRDSIAMRRRQAAIDTEMATWQPIVEGLHAQGVRHLTLPASTRGTPPPPLPDLIDHLLRASDPRLRQVLVPLLLTHPDYGPLVRERIEYLPSHLVDRARRLYVIAAAAQRMWRSRLQWALGPQVLLAPAFEEDLRTPSLDQEYGEAAFVQVAEDEEALYGYNALAGYEALVDQVLAEMDVGNWGSRGA